jgi:hypothetical protein
MAEIDGDSALIAVMAKFLSGCVGGRCLMEDILTSSELAVSQFLRSEPISDSSSMSDSSRL